MRRKIGSLPFFEMRKFEKRSKASFINEFEESSMIGISTLNLDWVIFLSFLVGSGIGLFNGFFRVEKRARFA